MKWHEGQEEFVLELDALESQPPDHTLWGTYVRTAYVDRETQLTYLSNFVKYVRI